MCCGSSACAATDVAFSPGPSGRFMAKITTRVRLSLLRLNGSIRWMSRDARRRVHRQRSFIAGCVAEGVGDDAAKLRLIVGEHGWIDRVARRRGPADVHLIALPLISEGRSSARCYCERRGL